MPNPLSRPMPRAREDGENYNAQPAAVLECTVERVTFHNATNGYSVLRVLPIDTKDKVKADVITVLGAFQNPNPGESLRIFGYWTKHPQHGNQLKADRYETLRPATAAAMEKYLGSGMVKGIGPKMAERIIKKFGDQAFDVIENHPDKLLGIAGIGEKRVEMIQKTWEEQKEIRTVMAFLQGHGVSPTYALKIYKRYKDRSIEIVEQNPYQLAHDIWGIGFKSADKIAQNLGIAPDAPARLEAGLIYVLNDQMEGGGHCFLPREELIKKACEILLPQTAPEGDEVPQTDLVLRASAIEAALDSLIERELLVAETVNLLGVEDTAIYTPSIHTTEKSVAERVHTLLNSPWRSRLKPAEIDSIVTDLPGADNLSDEQMQAVRRAISEPIMVLTGGPGTGKCVVGDTLVLGPDGLRRMEEHWGDYESAPDTFREHSRPIVAKDSVTQTSHAYYGGLRETIRLQTKLGIELEGTPNHRIWAMTAQGPDWVRLDALSQGTFVAVRRDDDIWPETGITPDLAYLFGAISGDGSQSVAGSLILTNNDIPFLERCRHIIESHFGYTGRILPTRTTFELRVHSIGLRRKLVDMGLSICKSDGKVIPHVVLQSSRDAVLNYIAGLIDTDGHIQCRPGGNVVFEITLKSRQLIRQLQLLLLNVGIVSRQCEKQVRYRYKDRPEELRSYWRLQVTGANVDRLMTLIPTQKAVPIQNRICNPNKDIVPLPGWVIRELFTRPGKRSRREWWRWKREIKGERHATRERLLQLLADASALPQTDADEICREACRSCYYWDSVTTITPSSATVYDLTVPGEESFIANGIVNHNTTTTRVIIEAFSKLEKRLQVASPTGRAAKRATEVTGREAKTIHRLLAFDPEKNDFKHGPGEPLELDVLVIDESSMLDLVLTHKTLRAVPDGAQVIFVGDVDQLPSVGPGNVLADLINSGRVPVARLTQVFRQAAASKIITNAHAINKGKMPDLLPPSAVKEGADCVFIEISEPEEALEKIKGVVAKSLPRLGFGPDEITVLTPMQRGSLGGKNLNEVLQAVLNPPSPEKAEHLRGPITFRVGDRVMQRRNNYDKNVFNGDVGNIVEIDADDQTVSVQYPEQIVEYDFPDTDELAHAMAISIHKSQGSEYPAAIIVFANQHYTMLQRNLLYTGLTRAKKMAVLIGTKFALKTAIYNRLVTPRYTRLAQRLQNLVEGLKTPRQPSLQEQGSDGTGQRDLSHPPLPGRLF